MLNHLFVIGIGLAVLFNSHHHLQRTQLLAYICHGAIHMLHLVLLVHTERVWPFNLGCYLEVFNF